MGEPELRALDRDGRGESCALAGTVGILKAAEEPEA